jgi:uncharacterized damage-inducible protein DinB
MQKLTDSDLEKPFECIAGRGKRKHKGKAILTNALWHLIGEDLQHRGEINAILYQEKIGPPITTWCYWKADKSTAHDSSTSTMR